MEFAEVLSALNDFVWGPMMLALLMGTGIFLTVRLKFLPWRNLRYALKLVFVKSEKGTYEKSREGDITPFQSLMTALAATIGTGNIVGVATAMVLGGAGALVWMWISALFGLSVKYAESVLAVKYREKNDRGEMAGGPMYAMKNGFKIKPAGRVLAMLFAVFALIASFGIGNMTQGNSISGAVRHTFGIPVIFTGVILTILSFLVLVGGIRRIGRVCAVIVPVMAALYLVSSILVIGMNYEHLFEGLKQIIVTAFGFEAMGGGIVGTLMADAIRWGVARGVFSNEAGLGSAPIAAAAAKTEHPSEQGYINMTGTFFDTLVMCTITGLSIVSSGMLSQIDPSTGKALTGAELTISVFRNALGMPGAVLVTTGLCLFAFSTILGWEYYGEKCLEYLAGNSRFNQFYRICFSLMVFVGATVELQLVWNLSDAFNGMMAIPNLICLLVLSKVTAKECFDYQERVLGKYR